MPTEVYCYHCRTSHPREEMRRVETKTGKRWRCIHSIEAVKVDRETRDAFGRKVSEANRAKSQAIRRVQLKAEA